MFITGATGQIGRRLVADRLARGDDVWVLSRDAARASTLLGDHPRLKVIHGDPTQPGPWQAELAGFDSVVNLAGANIADRRWTAAFKNLILTSRVQSTSQLVQSIKEHSSPDRPATLINASATGYYGDRGDQALDEQSSPGNDFLARVVVDWEQQAHQAQDLGVRVVLLRNGAVLDSEAGALKKMMLPFKLFAGGPLGNGSQYLPWIHWHDVIGLIDLALRQTELEGPVNAVAPESVRQRDFAKQLGAALHRPSWMPAPKFVMRLALGEMANALTASQCVIPAKAVRLGYAYQYPLLSGALNSLLGVQHGR